MKEVSNTTIMVLLVIGIIISFGGAFLNLNRLAQMGAITGYATMSSLNVTIATYKAIAVTGSINFGSGYATGSTGAWMDSGDTSTTNGTWTWSGQSFTIENQGNAVGAIYANASQDPATWIGTDGQAYLNGTEPGSDNGCSGATVGNMMTYQNALNSTGTITICSALAAVPNTADTVLANARIFVSTSIGSSATPKWTNVTFFVQ